MKQRSLLVFCIILGIAGFAAGQTRTMTNADLEKYRQERLKAEKDYRDNYARLGRPSPEELDRRREQSFKETQEMSAKLRALRLESERIDAERQANELRAASSYSNQFQNYDSGQLYYDYPFFWSYGDSFGGRGRFRNRHPYQQQGYYAGGQFWPTGPATRPRPMLVQAPGPRPRPHR
jgi:hypothetical protein